VDIEVKPFGVAALEPADVRLRHPGVGLNAEQERNVDVDALVDRLLDRRQPLGCAGDLDHRVGTVHALPVLARLRDRAVAVEG